MQTPCNVQCHLFTEYLCTVAKAHRQTLAGKYIDMGTARGVKRHLPPAPLLGIHFLVLPQRLSEITALHELHDLVCNTRQEG